MVTAYPALAEEKYVEQIADEIYDAIYEEQFDIAETILNYHITENSVTRHGSDTFTTAINIVLKRINDENGFILWQKKTDKWLSQSKRSFSSEFFHHQIRYKNSLHFKNSKEWKNLLQSVRRKHQKTLDSFYDSALRLLHKYPDHWRIHSDIVANYTDYNLTYEELNEHLFETQKLKPGDVASMVGHIKSLAHESLGRDDDIITKGISNILKKYPERNLSKPEYIDEKTKQEIKEEIFELTIARVLSTARRYNQKSTKNSSAPSLIPLAYKTIYNDLKSYYGESSEKLQTHPLSIKRQAVWNEIVESYNLLTRRFPNSGHYLSDYLEISMELKRNDQIENIINKIEKHDPNYHPARLKPLECLYFSTIKPENRTPERTEKMYQTCKIAVNFKDEEIYHYRAGWAARQLGYYEESNMLIENALKLAPDSYIYMTDICWNYKDLNIYDKALDYCNKAITTNRMHPRAWLGRSHIYYHGFKDSVQAQKDAEQYKRLTK